MCGAAARATKMKIAPPQRIAGALGLLLTLPLLLAWLAVQVLPILDRDRHPAVSLLSYRPLSWLLVWGPLLETVLLLLAAATVAQVLAKRQPESIYNTAICTGIVGLSFVASHILQSGTAALASLPMGLLLSAGAAYAVQRACRFGLVRHALALFGGHALYNASLLGFSANRF